MASSQRPDQLSECAGAPSPLPPNGWPVCRRKTGTVTALEERRAKLEGQIKAAGTAGATGDLGSALWAWALSWLGLTAGAIRKGSVLCFAVGLDLAIWSLVALADHLWATMWAASRRSWQPSAGTSDLHRQSDYLTLDHPAILRDKPDHPARGTKAPNRPKPSAPNSPAPSAGEPDGRTDDRKGRVLTFVQTEQALGRSIPRQADLTERFGVPRSTLSDWCREWEADGSIPTRRMVGRCKAIVAG